MKIQRENVEKKVAHQSLLIGLGIEKENDWFIYNLNHKFRSGP